MGGSVSVRGLRLACFILVLVQSLQILPLFDIFINRHRNSISVSPVIHLFQTFSEVENCDIWSSDNLLYICRNNLPVAFHVSNYTSFSYLNWHIHPFSARLVVNFSSDTKRKRLSEPLGYGQKNCHLAVTTHEAAFWIRIMEVRTANVSYCPINRQALLHYLRPVPPLWLHAQ
jgi:hypothetical protein